MSNQQNNKLFTEFPPVSTQQWEEKIKADLKGADYDRKLIWKTIEGFNVRPYYRREDLSGLKNLLQTLPGELPYIRGNKKDNNWLIRQDIFVNDEQKANAKALAAIKRGAESIAFIIPEDAKTNLNSLLNGFPFDKVEINFSKLRGTKKLLQEFIDYCTKNNIDTKKLKGSFDFDPLGYTTLTGQCYDAEICEGMSFSKPLFAKAKEIFPDMHFVCINGKYFNNAGASIVQELAFSLSIAVEYLNFAQEQGIDVADLSPHLRFNLGIGSNYFMEIAKLRAVRYLWAKIMESYLPAHPEKAKIFIHSETSLWNKTLYDVYVNMLRTTTEAMSAVLGGSDSLTILPFNAIYENDDEFGERIARNQQIILKEESYFNKVTDPAAGSYYIENLTNSLIEQAWSLFLETEEQGGYLEALKKGFVQEKIAKTTQKRDMDIAMCREVFLGTNQYPNQNEQLEKGITEINYFPKTEKGKDFVAEPLKVYRGAQAFETLRSKVESTEKIPSVFLFTYGNLAMRKARASFSSNFFACAGFNVIDNFGFETVEQGIEAAQKSDAEIIVICSSDDEYEQIAPQIYHALKDKKTIVVAGYPKNILEKLQNEGIEHFIHIKSNALEELKRFYSLNIH